MCKIQEVIIYRFCEEDNTYISSERYKLRGNNGLPPNTTMLIPPNVQDGYIPVYIEGRWVVKEDNFWKPVIEELNYNSGRLIESYKPEDMTLFGLMKNASSCQNISKICNSMLVLHTIIERDKVIHDKFRDICEHHKNLIPKEGVPIINDLVGYKVKIESLVYLIKRNLDFLVQLTELLIVEKKEKPPRKLHFEGVGNIINTGNKKNDELKNEMRRLIIGDKDKFQEDSTGFLNIINDVFNSMKHCFMHVESDRLIGVGYPTLVTYFAPYNNYERKITFHNHSVHHIVMGYQDNLKRIFENHRIYKALK